MFADKPETPFMEKAKFWPYALFFSIFSWVSMSLIISTIQWNYIWFYALVVLMVLCGLICSPLICLCLCDKEEKSEAISEKEGRSEAIPEKEERAEAISEKEGSSEAIYDKDGRSEEIPVREESSEAIPDKEGRLKSKGQFKVAIGQDKEDTFMSTVKELQAIENIAVQTKTQAVTLFVNAMFLVVIAVLKNFYPETWIWNLWAQGYKLSDVAIVSSGYFNIVFGSCISSGILYVILHHFQVAKPEREKQAKIKEDGKKHKIDLDVETPV